PKPPNREITPNRITRTNAGIGTMKNRANRSQGQYIAYARLTPYMAADAPTIPYEDSAIDKSAPLTPPTRYSPMNRGPPRRVSTRGPNIRRANMFQKMCPKLAWTNMYVRMVQGADRALCDEKAK